MGIISRILGICRTKPPADPTCWRYADGTVDVALESAPELTASGGAIRLEGSGLPLRLLVFRDDKGEFHALHNKCTHMGRRLDPLPGQTEIECCSVNKSRFSPDGEKLAGPAKGPVQAFPVEKRDGKLVINLK